MSKAFNYIAFGNKGYVEGASGTIEMNRGRMFEYTPTDIEKRLESLDSEALAFLETLPTFLCSEISYNEKSTSMIVKYGTIKNTKISRREVATDFTALVDFGDVEFADVNQAQALFGADGFQLYRTHWAVREGDAKNILAKLATLKPNLNDAVTSQTSRGPVSAALEPPQRAKNILGVARSVEEFLKLLYDLPPKESTELLFRGHGNSAYELTPSLLRKFSDGAWQFLPHEERLCKELLISHYDEFQGDQYTFDRLVRMQHYGLPTRLLDISSNPLVALFFACHGGTGASAIEGEVIIFTIASGQIKYYDSDTVSCLANLSNLSYRQKNEIDLTLNIPGFNETDVALRLLHHIKSEKSFFESRIIPDDLGSVLCVKAKRTNNRIKSQSGAFLLFGHEASLPESGQEGIEISRVKIVNKQHILEQLDRININATTVYPSIDRTAIHLQDRYLSNHGS